MEIVKFVLENADRLTVISFQTLLIILMAWVLGKTFTWIKGMVQAEKDYLISQVAERNHTIQEMTKVLLEVQELMSTLTNAVDSNKKEIIAEIGKIILTLEGKIQQAIINSLKGGGN